MKTNTKRIGPVFLLFVHFVNIATPHCSRNKECNSCTQQKTWSGGTCRWCPLNDECHAKWSLMNPCLKQQNLKYPKLCDSDTGGLYKPWEAYKLAVFSAIAYSDEPDVCLKAILPMDDFFLQSIIIVECDDYLFDYKKQCLALIAISVSRKEIIVAFRGTRGVKQIVDEVLTIIGKPKVNSIVGGKTQHYFENVHRKLYSRVKKSLLFALKMYPGFTVKLTGHSLGGAVASITSAMLVKEKTIHSDELFLYTFGMPRVGNKIYAESHDKLVKNSWRVVRDGDYFSRLPKCVIPPCSLFNGPYHHGNKVLYTGEMMNPNSPFTICRGMEEANSKCKTRRGKRGVVDIMEKHKNYFGIPIGTYCRDYILKDKKNIR